MTGEAPLEDCCVWCGWERWGPEPRPWRRCGTDRRRWRVKFGWVYSAGCHAAYLAAVADMAAVTAGATP